MALARSANDKLAIRNDTGSNFGGTTVRDGDDDSQLMYLDGNNVVITNQAESYRVVYKAVDNDYQGAGDVGITERDAFNGDIVNLTRYSVIEDYKLNWGDSRFNSISLEYKVGDSWVLSYQIVNTSDPSDALPNRYISDTDSLDAIKTLISNDVNANYQNSYYASWEYQCALYNWQYMSGYSNIQYLFGDDTITGTRNNDVLYGGAGNDTLKGSVGNDVLVGSFGADTIYGDAGSDIIIFDGGSSVWDYDALNSFAQRGVYTRYSLDVAFGGTGVDYFTFELPSFRWVSGSDKFDSLPDLFGGNTLTSEINGNNYNPFLSQSQISTPFSTNPKAYNVSPLTFRTRIGDFKVGEDKLDFSNLGIDFDFINNRALNKLSGTSFIKAVNIALAPDGVAFQIGKSSTTSNHTTLFLVEILDTNFNGTKNDTLIEIQLVGLSSSAIGVKLFGEAPV